MMVTEEHIDQAFDQIETITKIHEGSGVEAQTDAMAAYLEFLGLSEDAAHQLAKRVNEFVPEEKGAKGAYGWLYMGVVIGLTSAVKATESY